MTVIGEETVLRSEGDGERDTERDREREVEEGGSHTRDAAVLILTAADLTLNAADKCVLDSRPDIDIILNLRCIGTIAMKSKVNKVEVSQSVSFSVIHSFIRPFNPSIERMAVSDQHQPSDSSRRI